MSPSLMILLQILFGMLLANIAFSGVQARASKSRSASLTAMGLWICTTGNFLVAGVLSEATMSLLTVFGYAISLIQALLLLRFANVALGTHFRYSPFVYLMLAMWVPAVALYFLGAPFWVYCFPVAVAVAAPFLWLAVATVREKTWRGLSFAAKTFVVTTFLMAIHELDFPFLRPYPETTIFGAVAVFTLLYAYSLVMPSLVDERARRDYEKVLENEVNQKTQMLLSSSRMAALGEMAGGVAHEINNPLAVISNSVSILKDEMAGGKPEPEVMNKYLGTIEKTVKRIATIIVGLRTFSRDSAEDPMTRHPLSRIVEESLALCSEKLKQKGVELRMEPIPEDLFLECRPAQISQVILNLISNASDAVEGSREKWIRVEAQRIGQQIRMTIEDSGPGVPKEIRDRIFQPFFTTKAIGQGTGLGLSVSSGIIQAHKGVLNLDPSAKHTTFVITLPAA